jgi:hypothetical protein
MDKTIDIQIPEFLTIDQYRQMASFNSSDPFSMMIQAVKIFTGYSEDEIRQWKLESIKDLANQFNAIADPKSEFHSIVEWNDVLYGYCPVGKATLGEFIDIENLTKDLAGNMHKLCAILYRPITKHRFKSMKFTVKQKIKMANNSVENVFDWYETEKYDSNKRKMVEESFKDFPVHIFLGAVSFFLSSVNLYSISTLSSDKKISKSKAKKMLKETLDNLSANTGAGGGLFTTSLSPIYYSLRGMSR